MSTERVGDRPTSWAAATASSDGAREALSFLLSSEGAFFRASAEASKRLRCEAISWWKSSSASS